MMFEEKICVGPINPHSEGQFYGSLAWGQIHMSAKVDTVTNMGVWRPRVPLSNYFVHLLYWSYLQCNTKDCRVYMYSTFIRSWS